jgi:hypothetical protein
MRTNISVPLRAACSAEIVASSLTTETFRPFLLGFYTDNWENMLIGIFIVPK